MNPPLRKYERIPPEAIERWVTVKTKKGYRRYPIPKRGTPYYQRYVRYRKKISRKRKATTIPRSVQQRMKRKGHPEHLGRPGGGSIPGKRKPKGVGTRRQPLPRQVKYPSFQVTQQGERIGPGIIRTSGRPGIRGALEYGAARVGYGALTGLARSTAEQAEKLIRGKAKRQLGILRLHPSEREQVKWRMAAEEERQKRQKQLAIKAGISQPRELGPLGHIMAYTAASGARGVVRTAQDYLRRNPYLAPLTIDLEPKMAVKAIEYFRSINQVGDEYTQIKSLAALKERTIEDLKENAPRMSGADVNHTMEFISYLDDRISHIETRGAKRFKDPYWFRTRQAKEESQWDAVKREMDRVWEDITYKYKVQGHKPEVAAFLAEQELRNYYKKQKLDPDMVMLALRMHDDAKRGKEKKAPRVKKQPKEEAPKRPKVKGRVPPVGEARGEPSRAAAAMKAPVSRTQVPPGKMTQREWDAVAIAYAKEKGIKIESVNKPMYLRGFLDRARQYQRKKERGLLGKRQAYGPTSKTHLPAGWVRQMPLEPFRKVNIKSAFRTRVRRDHKLGYQMPGLDGAGQVAYGEPMGSWPKTRGFTQGRPVNKQISSTPVSGMMLVRQDLHGGRRRRKRRRNDEDYMVPVLSPAEIYRREMMSRMGVDLSRIKRLTRASKKRIKRLRVLSRKGYEDAAGGQRPKKPIRMPYLAPAVIATYGGYLALRGRRRAREDEDYENAEEIGKNQADPSRGYEIGANKFIHVFQ